MAISRAEKEAEIQQLAAAFKSAENVILLDYKGLNVLQATELRRQIRAAQAQYRVVKNTLAKRVLQGTVVEPLAAFFQGTTAVAFSGDDPVALAKALTSFAKTAPALTVKAAVVQGRTVTASEVTVAGRTARQAGALRDASASAARSDGAVDERVERGASGSHERFGTGGKDKE